jgi:hypothetical protein
MRGRPFKHYRDELDTGNTGYRVIEKHLDDLPAKDDSPGEDFLLSDNNKEVPSPKKERIPSPRKEHHITYKKHEEHVPYRMSEEYVTYNKPEEHISYKKHEEPKEKHLKDLIEDKDILRSNRNKFDDVLRVQSTSFHIPIKQQEKKDIVTTNSGFTIGTSKVTYPTKTTNIPTSKPKKEEQPTQPQMPYMYPYPMFYPPQGYDPNTQQNMPMTPQPMMYYMPPQYMQQPEKEPDTRKPFNFPQSSVN